MSSDGSDDFLSADEGSDGEVNEIAVSDINVKHVFEGLSNESEPHSLKDEIPGPSIEKTDYCNDQIIPSHLDTAPSTAEVNAEVGATKEFIRSRPTSEIVTSNYSKNLLTESGTEKGNATLNDIEQKYTLYQLDGGSKTNQNKAECKIKESKIGLKKPREKLGERLGNKKLGSRMTKPLVGISSDSYLENEDICKDSNKARTTYNPIEPQTCSNEVASDDKNTVPSMLWGSWGQWSSTVAMAASTFNRVDKGIETVLETVQNAIGAPPPEVLAQETVEIERKMHELSTEDSGDTSDPKPYPSSFSFGLGNISQWGSLVSVLETAGSKVLQGGLDTLEMIGRKTMDVLQEGDPGLRRKRAFLKSRGSQNLSMVLREARQRALEEENNRFEVNEDSESDFMRNIYIGNIWDGTEGAAHLQALELIAKQSQVQTGILMKKLPALTSNNVQPLLSKLKNCCEIDEEGEYLDVSKELSRITRDVSLPLQFGSVLMDWPSLEEAVKKMSIEIRGFCKDDMQKLDDIQKDLYLAVTKVISQVVAVTHKAAERSLIAAPSLNCQLLAQQFREICSCLSFGLGRLADDICEAITRALPASEPNVSKSVTNIYVQMAEASGYLQNSLLHLVSVLIHVEAKLGASKFL